MMPDAKPTPYATYAPRLSHLGYYVVPTHAGQKRPAINNWQTAYEHQDEMMGLVSTHGDCSASILTRGLAGIDSDVYHREAARAIRDMLYQELNLEPSQIPTRVGQAPKALYILRRAEGPMPKMSSGLWRDPVTGTANRLEVMGDGQQVVVYGTHPSTRGAYLWPHRDIVTNEVSVDRLPVVDTATLERVLDRADEIMQSFGMERVQPGSSGAQGDGEVPFPVAGLTLEVAAEALKAYHNDDLHYDSWLAVGMALHQQFDGYAEAFELWDEWSSGSPKDRGTSVNWRHWQSFAGDRPGGVTMRSVLAKAEGMGWERPGEVEGARVSSDGWDVVDENEPRAAEPAKPEGIRGAVTSIGAGFDPAAIPRREWVVPGALLAGHVTAVAGPPGVSKSVTDLTRAIAVATGRELLGEPIARSGPVLVINNEDDLDEIHRRVAAICQAHDIRPQELEGRLHVISGYGQPWAFAARPSSRDPLSRTVHVEGLVSTAKDLGAVMLVVDPLISTARGASENDNADTEFLVSIWRHVAKQTNAAVSLTHHTRKGSGDSEAHAGELNALRGGGALGGAVRFAFTLARMSVDTAERLRIPPEEARRLVRIDNAKANYSLPEAEARWLRLESVTIPNGESIGVPLPTDLDDIEREEPAQEPDGVLHRRQRLAGLFKKELEDSPVIELPLARVADRWAGAAQLQPRRAMDQVRLLVPECDASEAVEVIIGPGERRALLWREVQGEGRGARHAVFMAISEEDEQDDWMS